MVASASSIPIVRKEYFSSTLSLLKSPRMFHIFVSGTNLFSKVNLTRVGLYSTILSSSSNPPHRRLIARIILSDGEQIGGSKSTDFSSPWSRASDETFLSLSIV